MSDTEQVYTPISGTDVPEAPAEPAEQETEAPAPRSREQAIRTALDGLRLSGTSSELAALEHLLADPGV